MSIEIESPELKEAFDLFDFRKEGKIDVEETIESLKRLEYETKNPAMFELVSSLGTGALTYKKFEEKITALLNTQKDDEGMHRIFNLFINNKKQDTISFDSLKKICRDLGETFTDKDAEFIIDNVGDGSKITFEQFKAFMQKKFS